MGMINKPSFSYSEESDYEKQEASIKEIVLRHIRKISDISCQELTEGYNQERPVKVGDSVTILKEYHPDLKEAYCNAVDFLTDIIYPNGDTIFKEIVEKHEKDEKDLEGNDKLQAKRRIFKQINLFFNRINYFTSGDTGDE